MTSTQVPRRVFPENVDASGKWRFIPEPLKGELPTEFSGGKHAKRSSTTLSRPKQLRGVMEIRSFQDTDEPEVIRLWERCGLTRPWNDPSRDIARKRRVQSDLFLVGTIEGTLVASAMVGYDGHRGWINYLAVDPDRQRQGLASAMMIEAERRLRELGCAKINLQVRRDNIDAVAFYQHLGFTEDAVVSFGKRLEQDATKMAR